LDPAAKTIFTKGLLFIALNLVDDYNTPVVHELLEKDEDELLQPLWDLYTDITTYLPSKIDNFKARDGRLTAVAFHKLSLLRSLAEFAGIKRDVRQYKLDLSYSVNDNNNIYGSIFGISGSKSFGTFDSEKMIGALSKSPVFRGATIRKPDIMELSAKLMS
jgi:hypothetical protein